MAPGMRVVRGVERLRHIMQLRVSPRHLREIHRRSRGFINQFGDASTARGLNLVPQRSNVSPVAGTYRGIVALAKPATLRRHTAVVHRILSETSCAVFLVLIIRAPSFVDENVVAVNSYCNRCETRPTARTVDAQSVLEAKHRAMVCTHQNSALVSAESVRFIIKRHRKMRTYVAIRPRVVSATEDEQSFTKFFSASIGNRGQRA